MSSNRDTNPIEWPDARQFPRSIRLQFSLYIAAIVLVLMTATGVVVTKRYVDTVARGATERLLLQARSYSGSAAKHLLSAENPDALMLSNICNRLTAESEEIYWAAITDRRNALLAHTDVRLVAAGGLLPVWNGKIDPDLLLPGETYLIAGDTIRIAVLVQERGVSMGRLELAASTEQISSAKRQTVIAMGSITIVVLLIGLPLTMVLTHRKLRPVSVIAEYLRNTNFDDINLDIPVKSRNEFGYLAETLNTMGSRLNRAQAEMLERERMAKELEIAREIQANILPKAYPSATDVQFAGVYHSAREVGGDYFDFIEFDSTHLGFLVADVSGKSLPGMLVMLLTRDIVKQASRHTMQPAELLSQVNRELLPSIKNGMFVTMFFGVLDRSTGRFDFASAGHNPLLHVSASKVDVGQYRPNGFPLGMMPPPQFDKRIQSESVVLRPGDVLVQYSDGINEAQNELGDEYGMERLTAALRLNASDVPESMVDRIIQEHSAFVGDAGQYDDITLVAMKWFGQTADKYTEIRTEKGHEHQHING